jgi:predicted cupin superfamily sugar epimerase
MLTMNVRALIAALELRPLPVEGGLFRQTYIADESLPTSALPARYTDEKPLSTLIYYLLTDDPDSFSALHKLPTDEIYHFYLGDPVEHLELHPDGSYERVVLGHDVLNGQRVQHVAPRGSWQGSRLIEGGRFALMGTTMAPGFTASDYLGADRGELLSAYPEVADSIRALTRTGVDLRMPD